MLLSLAKGREVARGLLFGDGRGWVRRAPSVESEVGQHGNLGRTNGNWKEIRTMNVAGYVDARTSCVVRHDPKRASL